MTTTESPATVPWEGAIFDGTWRPATETVDVIAPATGKTIATVGLGTSEDLDAAVSKARAAQRAWGRATYYERATVFRRAAALLRGEPGPAAALARPRVGLGDGQGRVRDRPGHRRARRGGVAGRPALWRAAAQRQAAPVGRPPVAGRHRRSHLAVQLPGDPVDALGGPGPGPGQRRDPQARRPHARSRAVSCMPSCSPKPGCPKASSTCCPAEPTSVRRSCSTPACRASRSRAPHPPGAQLVLPHRRS